MERSGNGIHIRWLLYVHTDSNVSQQGKKGEDGVKPLEDLFLAVFFTSTSKHLRLQWWGQVLIFNVIRVDC